MSSPKTTGARMAAFLADGCLHAVRSVKERAIGWCGDDSDAGIHYVPDWAFDGRDKHEDADVCLQCRAALTLSTSRSLSKSR